ncbi:MAG: PIN domain-containing protein [Acidimicrobiales bacterium]
MVKLHATEPGSQVVGRLTDLVVSSLARVEVPAAIWKKSRTGELTVANAQVLVQQFEVDFLGTAAIAPRFDAIVATGGISSRAAVLRT